MKSDRTILTETLCDLLSKGCKVTINAEGYSMYPLLHPGDKLTVAPAQWESLRKGDIIAWRTEDKLVAHRIVEKQASYCITAGDATIRNDGKTYPQQILGKVTHYQRDGKTKSMSSFSSHIISLSKLYAATLSSQLFIRLANIRKRKERLNH